VLPPKNDPFGAELRRLADNLDRERLRAVSEGLGIGNVRTIAKERQRYEEAMAQESFNKFDKIPAQPNDELDFLYREFLNPPEPVGPLGDNRDEEFLVSSPKSRSLRRLVFAHAIDLGVVIFSLTVALLAVGMFVAPVAPCGAFALASRASDYADALV
jgi:hypothetical protein